LKGLARAIAVGLLGAAPGCTNDFDVFTPVADGGAGADTDSGATDGAAGDGAPGDAGRDAATDAACTPDPTCLSTARSCSQACPFGARRAQCVQQCQQTCVACTQTSGCASPTGCATAVR
jgi:hypothetical protein